MKLARTLSLGLISLCGMLALAAGPQLGDRPAPASASGVGRVPPTVASALIFDYHIPIDKLKADELSANVGYVWGAAAPEQRGGHARHDYYLPWGQGCTTAVAECPHGGPPSFPWLKAHHPDWILWKTNKLGVPTAPVTYKFDPGPILDFTNPALQQYWVAHYIVPALKQGFDGIAWDSQFVYNPYGAVGHFDYYRPHHFIRMYSGKAVDSRWAHAQANALGQFLQRARARAPKVKFALNLSFDCEYAPIATWALPLPYIDTIVDEQGYTDWGTPTNWIASGRATYCANRWLAKTNALIQAQKAGKHLVLINEEPLTSMTPYMTDHNQTARAYLQSALASYLLVKYSHTYFWFGLSQGYGNPIVMQRELLTDFGQPQGDMHHLQSVYVRWFTKGAALVNPDQYHSFTFTLPKNKYETLYGQRVNRVALAVHSGVVLTLIKH